MLAVTVASLRGAPGATTTAALLAAAWPVPEGGRSVLVEADPDGGVVAARWNLTETPSIVDLVLRNERDLVDAAQIWTDRTGLVVAPSDATVVTGALIDGGDRLGQLFGAADDVVVADVGRLAPSSPAVPLATTGRRCVIVVRRRLDQLAAVAGRAVALFELGVAPTLVVLGDGPYGNDEITAATGVRVAGELPDDRRGAEALWAGDTRRLRRTLLWRRARDLADGLAAEVVAAEAVA